MVKNLFHGFVFLAPFTSFFAISAWLRLPVIANQLLLLIVIVSVLIYGKVKTKFIFKEDLYLLVFLALVWVSLLLGYREKRSFNHTLAYTNAIVFFFFLSKYVVKHIKVTSRQISRTMCFSFVVSSLIILIDFIGINYFDFSFRKLFSVVDGKISNMDYYIRSGFRRVGGVAEEPGTMALFYNLYFGATLYFLIREKRIKTVAFCVVLFLFCHFAMLSSAGIALALFCSLTAFLFEKISRNKITKKQVNWIFIFIIFTLITLTSMLIFNIGNMRFHLVEFGNKIIFNESGTVTSSGQRIFQWKRALTNFIQHPIFGHGPGFGVHEDHEGYLSVYLTILADIGMIAFIFFVAFQEAIFKKVIQLSNNIRPFLFFAVTTSFLHLCIVSDFYHAPLWILLVLIQLIHTEEKAGIL